jgi:hypothetical protein
MEENVLIKKFGTSRTQSCFELQARHEDCAEELETLIIDWKTHCATSSPPLSPRAFRRDRMSVKAMIDTLLSILPVTRSQRIQNLLHEIYILMISKCSNREKTHLEHIIFRETVVEDPLAIKFIMGITDEDLVLIPARLWKIKYIEMFLLEGDSKSIRRHVRRRSKLLIKQWLPLEPTDSPLRLNTPLRLLLRCWIMHSWNINEHEITSANWCLGKITTLPDRTRSILRFVSREFVNLDMELECMKGALIVSFIYFSCMMPLITDSARRRQLHEQFRILPPTDPFYTTARWSIFQ